MPSNGFCFTPYQPAGLFWWPTSETHHVDDGNVVQDTHRMTLL